MRYQVFDMLTRSLRPAGKVATLTDAALKSNLNPLADTSLFRIKSAGLQLSQRFMRSYPKQAWDYEDVTVGDQSFAVNESTVVNKPFCELKRFKREGLDDDAPKVLFIAALSGHHATLSKATLQEFLADHDVYVTDWLDAKMVPVSKGLFGFEEYTGYVLEFLRTLGPGVNVIALCQSGPAALLATALMSEAKDPCRPRALALLASPIDMRVNPGFLTKYSERLNIRLWKLANLHKVPARYPGAGRLVYPGILQLSAFMSMNIGSHVKAHKTLAQDIFNGREKEIDKHKEFYDEYFAMLDMSAEFCLETIERIFRNHDLARNRMTYQGQPVDLGSIKDVRLLAIEGANDDMIREGQCNAAVNICSGLPKKLKQEHIQEGVGHYGIFNGSIYKEKVAPRIKKFFS